MTYRCLTVLLGGSLVFAPAFSPDADACSPPLPGVDATIPESGQVYPSNAAIYLRGSGISNENLTVTVDGQAAVLATAFEFSATGLGFAYRIEPEPLPGQEVVVDGNPCSEFDPCEPIHLEWTAGEPDLSAPVGADPFWFGVYDWADPEECIGCCYVPNELGYFVHLSAEPQAGGAPEFFEVSVAPKFMQEPQVLRRANNGGASTIQWEAAEASEFHAAERYCFSVTVRDAAGNISQIDLSSCLACYYQEDPVGATPAEFPGEPAWTDADIWPGGPCDDGSLTTGGSTSDTAGSSGGSSSAGSDTASSTGASSSAGSTGTDSDSGGLVDRGSGCSCTAGGGGGAASWLLVLCLVGLRRRHG